MKPRLQRWLDFCKAHPELFQFGQTHDVSTFNGSTGCTHCYLQLMYFALTGKWLSHDDISHLCDYPWPAHNKAMRGMRASNKPSSELPTVIRKLHLPLQVNFFTHMTPTLWKWICERNNDGPIGAAVEYSHIPRDKRKHEGVNGFADIGGATQLGLIGGHLDIRLGYDMFADKHGRDTKPVSRWHDLWHDPDHGSPARRERPPFDRILSSQGKTMIESIQTLLVENPVTHKFEPRSIMVVTPTESIDPR